MTISQVIAEFDSLFPNALDFGNKKNTLLRLERRIYSDVLSHYDTPIPQDYPTLSGDPSPDTELLVASPYEELYVKFLACTADYLNGDILRYANSANVFNCLFIEFANFYNRTHRWKKGLKAGVAS